MTINPVDYASLLCSRLCQDLLSPIGALDNGLDLLADETDPAIRARCMDLLAESARVAANKLRFFRLAFGAAGGPDDLIETREAHLAMIGLFGGKRPLAIGWEIAERRLPAPAIKALLNLAMIAGDALANGGRIDVAGESGDGFEIVLRAEGLGAALDPDVRAILTNGSGGGDVATPRAAAAYLVRSLVTDAGGSVRVAEIDGALMFGVTFPNQPAPRRVDVPELAEAAP